jgi:hypothetical protein
MSFHPIYAMAMGGRMRFCVCSPLFRIIQSETHTRRLDQKENYPEMDSEWKAILIYSKVEHGLAKGTKLKVFLISN